MAITPERGNRGWTWRELPVDSSAEHIELRHGDASRETYEQWVPLALIGPPRDHVFPVQWLGGPAVTPEMGAEAERELTFYLVEKREPSPWRYAVYHSGTTANMYSTIHWSHLPTGAQGDRHSSVVVKLSTGEAADLFGDPSEGK